jgi:hypothetical protein
LLATPPTVTTTFPVVAPFGTGATILVALQLETVAVVPLKVTVLAPCVAPKFVPVIVTELPTAPDVGFRVEMLGETVKATPLLAIPPIVTSTFPVVAPLGTGATMLVALQLVGVAVVPLNVTVLVPWLPTKFTPVIVTDAPTAPELGLKLVMAGAVVPVPAKGIDMGTLFALFEIFRLPVLVPAAVGENVTLAVQVPDGAKGDEATQVSVSEKSPLVARLGIEILSILALVSANCCGPLEVPTLCPGKATEAGETASLGGDTFTGIGTWRDCPEIAYVAVIDAIPGPAAVTTPEGFTVATALFDDV